MSKMNRGTAAAGLVVGSKLKALVNAKGLKCSGDLLDALNHAVAALLEQACRRAKANQRATVRPEDL
jgi:histone H3/H4